MWPRPRPRYRFGLGGEGWGNETLPPNVTYLGFVPTARHTALYCSARLCLNINRGAMARYGYSPPTRVFEVTGCGGCLVVEPGLGWSILHPWQGGAGRPRWPRRCPPARPGHWDEARQIGAQGRDRALRDHTYTSRAHLLDAAT